MKIKITHLYPDLLDLYGDAGNIRCLVKRMEWRGIEVEVVGHRIDSDRLDFSGTDILFLGGGSDREERLVIQKLSEEKEQLLQYINSDKVLLAVCGGYRLLGRYYTVNGEKTDGLGLVDFYTDDGEDRFTGNVIIDCDFADSKVVGFENHSGRTYIGDYTPLGRVVLGNGNNGVDKTEGIVYKNVIGTYLYGPLLPKNPNLCDYIITNALKRKYADFDSLPVLDDTLENRANEFMVKRYEK